MLSRFLSIFLAVATVAGVARSDVVPQLGGRAPTPDECPAFFDAYIAGATAQCAENCDACPAFFMLVEELAAQSGCAPIVSDAIAAARTGASECMRPTDRCEPRASLDLEVTFTFEIGEEMRYRFVEDIQAPSEACTDCTDGHCFERRFAIEGRFPLFIDIDLPEAAFDLCPCESAITRRVLGELRQAAESLRYSMNALNYAYAEGAEFVCVANLWDLDSSIRPDMVSEIDPDRIRTDVTSLHEERIGELRTTADFSTCR